MRIISYSEPIPGLTKDGQEVACTRTIQINEQDVCNRMRFTIAQFNKNKGLSIAPINELTDKELISEFIAVNWAEIIEQEEKKHDLSDR